jgi:LTXXQ motif family protein
MPLQRIEQTIQPTEVQRHALDDLKAASSNAAGELQSSCPREDLHTRSDRLAAMNKRLNAMMKAVETVRPSSDLLCIIER